MPIPEAYEERVYAGVLGKIIGVYLGRPFEGWPHRRILEQLGEINYYVHERLDKPLVVSDDDISGTFTFIRALEDHGISREITAEKIGQTWLNYLIEKRTILWWGGMGTSTEHTAYLRLKSGIPAPESGAIALNTQEVAEQIGAQIFIDGWAMVAPGEPDLAAELAGKAGSVSHDGEALYGAQMLAAMESAAFFEPNLQKLLDTGLSFIPADSTIARLIHDIRNWHVQDADWKRTFLRIEEKYGYAKYGGGCHMVPNHALIILALLYGDDDFQKSLMVANTAGWDTDCNSGNVGCLMGIKNGLAGIQAGPNWRGPVSDRMFKISADGANGITDAVRETYRLCRIGRTLLDNTPLPPPKAGARYHFELPGSVQGFVPDTMPECKGAAQVENVAGHSRQGNRALAIHLRQIGPGRPARVGVQVFGDAELLSRGGYKMVMSPSLFPAQTVRAAVQLAADTANPVAVALYIQTYPPSPATPAPELVSGPQTRLAPGESTELEWQIPELDGRPVVCIGLECRAEKGTSGTLYLDSLTWSDVPKCAFFGPGTAAYRTPLGWTDAVYSTRPAGNTGVSLIQNEGRGLLINGEQAWENYTFSARVAPHLAKEAGIAVHVGGMKRFYALLLCSDGKLRLVKCRDKDTTLAECPFNWEPNQAYHLALSIKADSISASVDGEERFSVQDTDLPQGAIALINTEGRSLFQDVCIAPLS